MIRPGTMADADAMAAIFNYYVANSTVIFSNRQLDGAGMRAKLDGVAGEFPFYVSTDDDGRVTGYCYAHKWMPDEVYGRTWEITIYLDHEYRGHGIGGMLLRRVVDDCCEAGAHVLVSFVTQGNEPCERMHCRAGFALAGIIPESGFKFGRYLNDAVYTLKF